jgi:hypothetical protein
MVTIKFTRNYCSEKQPNGPTHRSKNDIKMDLKIQNVCGLKWFRTVPEEGSSDNLNKPSATVTGWKFIYQLT